MARRRYLVAYDIREPVRLRTVHRCVRGYGDPLQYSVFLCDLTDREKLAMFTDLRAIVNERVDSVAVVDLGPPDSRGVECFEFLGARMDLPKAGPRIF